MGVTSLTSLIEHSFFMKAVESICADNHDVVSTKNRERVIFFIKVAYDKVMNSSSSVCV